MRLSSELRGGNESPDTTKRLASPIEMLNGEVNGGTVMLNYQSARPESTGGTNRGTQDGTSRRDARKARSATDTTEKVANPTVRQAKPSADDKRTLMSNPQGNPVESESTNYSEVVCGSHRNLEAETNLLTLPKGSPARSRCWSGYRGTSTNEHRIRNIVARRYSTWTLDYPEKDAIARADQISRFGRERD